MNIGFFDSGIGGLTVLYEALKLLPNEDYIYYADTDNVPYGIKSKEEIRELVIQAVDFIVKQRIKALVVACNTATSAAIEDLRKIYDFPVIGMEPAVKPAVVNNKDKRVLVFATEMTLKEEKFKNLLTRFDTNGIVDYIPLQELVGYAENFRFDETLIVPYLHEKLSHFDIKSYGTVVLGCTHFPFFKNIFRKVLPIDIDIIDGNKGTIENLKRILDEMMSVNQGTGKIDFYNSGLLADDKSKKRFLSYLAVMEQTDI
jgi:glutamate racemase